MSTGSDTPRTAEHLTVVRTAALRSQRPDRQTSGWLLLAGNFVAIVTILVLLFTVNAGNSAMRTGEVAGETVIAQHEIRYPDHIATQARIRQVIAGVPIVYQFDTRPASLSLEKARTFLSAAVTVTRNIQNPLTREAVLRHFLPKRVAPSTLQQFFALPAADFATVQHRSLLLLTQAQAWKFPTDQVQITALALVSSIPSKISLMDRTAIGEVVSAYLTPTQFPDLTATKEAQEVAGAAVPTQYSTLYPGQVVIRRGDIVTPAVVEELAALGLQSRHTGWRDIGASILFAVVVVAMLFWYLRAFHASILGNRRVLLLLDAGLILTVAAARLVTGGHVLLPFLLPVAAVATFAGALIAPEACVALCLAMAILAGWVVANSFELTIFYFLSSAAGVLAIRRVAQLKQFIVAGLYISVFALGTMLAFGLLDQSYDFAAFREDVAAAAFNGFVSSALALGGFALLASFFGVTTVLQLFELGQPSQPLLRRLTATAPGTYNHSLVVSSMVEQAAEAVGANSLIARVSALYHDIGKTANPHCFVENQMGMSNIHDELPPDESARIIRGHVTHGIRLARQHRLPRPIVDAIREHHGSMSLAFFLHKAQHQVDTPIDVSLYSYPGPKPQSKETALLMLADGCESAVRAARDHSTEGIRTLVQRMFQERIAAGQLDESPLTLKDLDRAQATFCSVLNGLYHPRIEYPDGAEIIPEMPTGDRSEPLASVPTTLPGRATGGG